MMGRLVQGLSARSHPRFSLYKVRPGRCKPQAKNGLAAFCFHNFRLSSGMSREMQGEGARKAT